jgi:hypothetical protein
MYCDHIHARSVDSGGHESRDWVKRFHAQMKHEIPAGFRICGENLYARHSIFYDSLPSYFLVFAVFDGDTCLSWDETVEWCGLLSLEHVPLLYRGPLDWAAIKACWTGKSAFGPEQEGYVMRNAGRFSIDKFKENTAKYVRPDHVATDEHWMERKVEPNRLG